MVFKPRFADGEKKFYIQMIKPVANYNIISKHFSDVILSTLIRRRTWNVEDLIGLKANDSLFHLKYKIVLFVLNLCLSESKWCILDMIFCSYQSFKDLWISGVHHTFGYWQAISCDWFLKNTNWIKNSNRYHTKK